jgi:hypothetical protein
VTDRLLVTPVRRLPLIAGRVGQSLVQVVLQSFVIAAGNETVGASTDWASVAGYCGLLAAFAIVCLALATKAFGAYQQQV